MARIRELCPWSLVCCGVLGCAVLWLVFNSDVELRDEGPFERMVRGLDKSALKFRETAREYGFADSEESLRQFYGSDPDSRIDIEIDGARFRLAYDFELEGGHILTIRSLWLER